MARIIRKSGKKKLERANPAGLEGLARQERARRAGLVRLSRDGRQAMATKRVGLCFKEWQIAILEELARGEGFDHVATFLTREIHKLYPTLKRKPQKETRQLELLEDTARGTARAVTRAAGAARG